MTEEEFMTNEELFKIIVTTKSPMERKEAMRKLKVSSVIELNDGYGGKVLCSINGLTVEKEKSGWCKVNGVFVDDSYEEIKYKIAVAEALNG